MPNPVLIDALGHSPYLAGLTQDYGTPDPAIVQQVMDDLAVVDPQDPDAPVKLQEFKDQFDLGWAAAALTQSDDFQTLGRLRSDFAAQSIDKALHCAWHETLAKQKIKDVPLSGLFLLGLGKLGGYDLNFSSDVDLIAYFDADTLPISAAKGQKYIINKVLQRLTQILKPNHSARFIWRVDWRLRPESSTGSLSISTREAQNFYFFRALPWHRLALMKARVIAGDQQTGAAFLSEITPFIWRQNLDFRALDELAHLKTRINLEHPALSQERAQNEPITTQLAGFNVKLGSGGIREIEFIANAQQLVWGGKQYELRTPTTLTALSELARLGHMPEADAKSLSDIYKDLRRLENAIQMLDNAQTHLVPSEPNQQDQLIALLGYDSFDALARHSFAQRQIVNRHFKTLFEAEDTASDPSAALPDTASELAKDIAQSWLNGFDAHGLSRDKLGQFQSLGRTLLTRVIGASTATDEALSRIDQFLKTLSRSEQYFHLLARNPKLLDALITPLLYSPHMTVLLEQSPHIIDAFLDPQSVINAGGRPDVSFVFTDPDYETRLERLRRFVNENLYQYYHQFLESSDDTGFDLPRHLTDLADQTIEAAIRIVREDLGLSDLSISVLGLGKMATQRMAPMSDIDLIFIFGDHVESDLAAKVVRRLRTTLTTPLREGIAYDLDMRLRPSGRSGPPAVKLASFQSYHTARAKTWEHIALYQARIVAGDSALGKEVQAALDAIWAKARDRDQCLMDAKYMLGRLTEERLRDTPPNIWNTKLRRGGLMEADFLWRTFGVANITPPQDLLPVIDEWQEIELWERLLGLTGYDTSALPARYKSRLDTQITPKEILRREDVVRSAYATLFGDITLPHDHEMQPIHWVN